MKSIKTESYYTAARRAFEQEFRVTWGSTKFSNEVDSLCFFRALTCWYSSSMDDLDARRELLYRFAEPHFDTADAASTLNRLYQALPIKSGGKRIMRNICGLYNKEARRTFGNSDDASTADDIYRRSDIDTAMKTAHRFARLTNNCIIVPAIRNGVLDIDILPPDLYRVVLDEKNFRSVLELWIPVKRHGGKTEFNVWTHEQYIKCNYKGEVISAEPNRYGRIPVVFVQLEKDASDYYGGGMVELMEAELDNNFLKFLIDNNIVYSAFAVWIATNFGKVDFTLSPNKIICVNDAVKGDGFLLPPSLESVTPSDTFGKLEDLQNRRYQRALREMGLPATIYSPDAKTESGYSIFMQRQELMEIRQEDEPIFRRVEQELYELIAQMELIDMGVVLPPVSDFTIDYQEQSILLEPQKDFELKKEKLEYGILSPLVFVKELAGIDNLSTNEEAIEYLKSNRELFNSITAPQKEEHTNL